MGRFSSREMVGIRIALASVSITLVVTLALRMLVDVELSPLAYSLPLLITARYGGPALMAPTLFLALAAGIGTGIGDGAFLRHPTEQMLEISLLACLGQVGLGMSRSSVASPGIQPDRDRRSGHGPGPGAESEELFRELFSSLDEPMWIADLVANRILHVNHACEAMYGLPSAEIPRDLSRWLEFVHPDDRDRIRHALSVPLFSAPVDEECQIVQPGGTVRRVHLHSIPRKLGPDSRPTAFVLARDITHQSLMDRRAAELAKTLELANVLVRGHDDRIVDWNRGAEQLYGWTREEALGRISHELLTTTFPAPLGEIRAQVSARGSWSGELTHRRKDGGRVVVASFWMLGRDGEENPIRILEFDHDNSALKHIRAAFEDLNASLEVRIWEQTAEFEYRTARLIESEAALCRQRELLRAIIDSMSEGVLVIDTSQSIILMNSAASRLYDVEYLGRSAAIWGSLRLYNDEGSELIPRENWPIIKAMRGETTVDEPILARWEDQERIIRASSRPLLAEDGSIRGGVAVFRDITAEHQARIALEESEQRFRAFMDNSPTPAWLKDEDGNYVFASRAASEFNCRRDISLVGRTDQEVVPSDAEEFRRNDIDVLESGVARQFIERLTTPEGESRSFLIVKFPLTDVRGRRHVGGIGIEITERIKAEKELAERTRLLKLILEQMGDAVAVHGPDGAWLLTNPAFRQGFSGGHYDEDPDEIPGAYHLFLPDGTMPFPAEQLPLVRAMRGEKVDGVECIFRDHVTSEDRYFSMNARPLLDDDGESLGVVFVAHDVTRLMQAEARLKESEARFQMFMDNSPALAWTKDAEGRYTFINRACLDALRMWDTPFLGRTDEELFAGRGGEYRQADLEILETEIAKQLTHHVMTGEGRQRTILAVRFPLVDRLGRLSIGGVGIDVTEREEAEKACKEQAQLLEMILEQMGDGVAVFDTQGVCILSNSQNRRVVGRDWTGKSLCDLIPVDSIFLDDGETKFAYEDTPAMRAVRGESVDNVTTIVRDPMDGTEHWLSLNARPLMGDDGRPNGAIVVGRDITQMKRIEARLRESEERFRSFMDNSPALAWMKDREGRLVYYSRRFAEKFGIDEGAWIGKTDFDIWPEDDARSYRDNDLSVIQSGQPRDFFETSHLRGDIERYWWSFKFPFATGEGCLVAGIGIEITERRRAEQELARSEQRFRGAFEAASVGIAISDDGGILTRVNRAFASFLGYSDSNLIGMNYAQITHPDDLADEVELGKQLIAGSIRSFHRKKRYLHRNGQIVWGSLNISVVQDEEGKVSEVVGIVQDITKQVHGEEERRRGEAIIRSLYEGAPMMMGVVRLEGHDIIHVSDNRATAKFFGRTATGLTDESAAALGVPEDRRRIWIEAYRRCDDLGEPVQFEYPFRDPGHRSPRWLSATVCPVRPDGQQTTMYAYVAEEVTGRKDRERELERLVDILESTPDLVAMRTEDGHEVYLNASARRWARLPMGAIPEEFDARSMHPEGSWRKIVEEGIPGARRDGYWQGEVALLTPDGQECPFLQTIIAHRPHEGESQYFSAVIRDISSQRKFEEELRVARDEAVRANRLKSTFLANISHEIRTPMNAILGMTDVMLGGSPTPNQRESIEVIKTSAENLMLLINEILDLSKIEADRLELNQIPFDMTDVIDGAALALRERARSKGLALEARLPAGLPTFLGDPGRLRQVILNLVGNAIKFTERGHVDVSAEHFLLDTGRHRVIVNVRDTGIGIPSDRLESIFEPFEQADSSTTRMYGGTGLGLSISRRIVRLMGGEIEVESEEGRGSCFRFSITLPEAPPDVAAPGPQRVVESTAPVRDAGPGGPIRVLLVDDNPLNLRVGALLLEQMGLEVIEAPSGPDAIEAYLERPFDVVFMDVEMPGMDGIEAARRIRGIQEQRLRHVPIICLTAHAMKGDEERFLRSGMDGYLAKPISQATLRQVLDRHVGPIRGRGD